MAKSKLIICLFVLLFLSYSVCFATSDINMNLLSNSTYNTNTNNSTNTSNSITEEDDNDDIYEDETYSPSANISSTTYADSDELKIGDIINICLIVVGVLLILLSIAILIRLKN